MVGDDFVRLYRDHPLQDNPPGKYRPNEALIEAVVSRLLPAGRALDLSEDDGIDALFLAQSGYAVALMGLFPGELELARQRAEEAKAPIAVYTGEAVLFPFHADEFDLVFDPRVYSSLRGEERERFVREVHRVLRPGGVLLLLTPNYKDDPQGCFTEETVEERFHPHFETMRVVDTGTMDKDGGLRFYYSAMLRKPAQPK